MGQDDLPARLRTSAVRRAAAEIAAASGLRTGLVDGETASADLARVQLADRRLSLFVRAHLDERKSARPAGHLVAHDCYGFDGTCPRKQLLEIALSHVVRQVANIQLPTHNLDSSVAIATFVSIERDARWMSSRS